MYMFDVYTHNQYISEKAWLYSRDLLKSHLSLRVQKIVHKLCYTQEAIIRVGCRADLKASFSFHMDSSAKAEVLLIQSA